MRVWSIQPQSLFEQLKTEKVLHCDISKSIYASKFGFAPAYDWLVAEMVLRVSPPPSGVTYPFWAWHTLDWKHRKPDLRCIEFRAYSGKQVCIELEIPDNDVLLSDEERWHIVLNDAYLANSSNEQEYEAEDSWFEALTPQEQRLQKQKSWQRIFDVFPPRENEFDRCGRYIQACFWELRYDQVTAVRTFQGRQKMPTL